MNDVLPPDDPPPAARRWRVLLHIFLPVVVVAGGVAAAIGLISTPPKAQRKPPERQSRLVEVQTVHFGVHHTTVQAMGTVGPAREVELHPRASGEVIELNPEFAPGGRLSAGQMVLRIDPRDYELGVRQRESDVAQAQSDLTREQGQQSVAKREYEMLGETVNEEDRALVLRQPQLEKVRANLQAAQAALELARLHRERTEVVAPFNARVRDRQVNVGAQVTPATALGTLAGTDEYWIRVTLPVDQLRWIRIPHGSGETGSTVRVGNRTAWGPDACRTGRVIRLLSDLEAEGRMAQLLVAVEDPQSLIPENATRPRLLLGDYVSVEIDGLELESAAAVDRRLFRDGDRVWIMNAKGDLEIRPVEVAFRDRTNLFVTGGLRDGESVVLTDLSAAVDGMPLRTAQSGAPGGLSPGDGARPGAPQ